MRLKRLNLLAILMVGLFLAILPACGSTAATPAGLPGTAAALPQDVISGAQTRLSEALGVPLDSIQIDKVEDVQWSDACLELAQSGEECAQVITPGYRVALTVDGQTYEIHTNADGSMIRLQQ